MFTVACIDKASLNIVLEMKTIFSRGNTIGQLLACVALNRLLIVEGIADRIVKSHVGNTNSSQNLPSDVFFSGCNVWWTQVFGDPETPAILRELQPSINHDNAIMFCNDVIMLSGVGAIDYLARLHPIGPFAQ